MFVYRTPDDRAWLYGGDRPVGITDTLADKLDVAVGDVGALEWSEHSQLWAGAITGAIVEDLLEALVEALLAVDPSRTSTILSSDVATFLAQHLVHPG